VGFPDALREEFVFWRGCRERLRADGFIRVNFGEDKIVIKLTAFLTRKPGLSHEQFSAYWRDKHAPLVQSLAPFKSLVRRYVQLRPVEGVPNGLPLARYDGIAEIWFDNLRDVFELIRNEHFLSVVTKDEENFLDGSRREIFISQETAII
jgi:uncharacterized protein (TIGR02118 family)